MRSSTGRPSASQPLSVRLAELLEQELGFYRAVFVLLDQQRDSLRFEGEAQSDRICREVERIRDRILRGQREIVALRQAEPALFASVLEGPHISELVDRIADSIRQSQSIVADNIRLAESQKAKLAEELRQLSEGSAGIRCYGTSGSGPRFVDQEH